MAWATHTTTSNIHAYAERKHDICEIRHSGAQVCIYELISAASNISSIRAETRYYEARRMCTVRVQQEREFKCREHA